MRNANKKSTETINYPLHRMLNIRLHNFIASIPVFVSYFKNLTHQTTFVLYDQKMKEGSKLDSEVAFRNFEIEHQYVMFAAPSSCDCWINIEARADIQNWI